MAVLKKVDGTKWRKEKKWRLPQVVQTETVYQQPIMTSLISIFYNNKPLKSDKQLDIYVFFTNSEREEGVYWG